MQQSKAPTGPLPRKNSTGGKNKNKKKTTPPSSSSSTASKQANGAPPGFVATAKPTTRFSEQQQRMLRHRALFAFRFLVGKAVDVQLVDGSRYMGILDCIDPDTFSIVLKNTQRKSGNANESFECGSTVIFKRLQVAHMMADGVVNYNENALGAAMAASSGFRTDTEISGRSAEHLYGRELQSALSWLDPSLDTGELEDTRRRSSSKSGWNQFEANEKLFGVVSSFDENLYTTKLDRTKISTEQSKEAERIAREIERQMSANFHLQEERGHGPQQDGLDEEARYSSVDRRQQQQQQQSQAARGPNAYVPPALRNVTRQTSGGKPQATGAPQAQPQPQKPDAKPAAAPAAPQQKAQPTSTPAPAPTPAPVAAAPASTTAKPLSFSEAVRGRATVAAAAKPASQPLAAPAPAPAPAPQPASPKKTSSPKKTKSTPASPAPEKKPEPKAVAEKKEQEKTATPVKSEEKPAPKKGLNPNAKEFKLSASAAEFTPKYMTQTTTSSAYRPHQQPHHHHHPPHHHHPGVMYHPHFPAPMYAPMPDEWMYDGGMGMDETGEFAPPQMYMGYGVPMGPGGAMMQQPMYPPMAPQPAARGMMPPRTTSGGASAPGTPVAAGGAPSAPGTPGTPGAPAVAPPGAFPYQQAPPPFAHARGFYPPTGPYGGPVMPQPPLPRDPTPSETSSPRLAPGTPTPPPPSTSSATSSPRPQPKKP